MEKGSIGLMMGKLTKENGRTTYLMVKGSRHFGMDPSTKAVGKKTKKKD